LRWIHASTMRPDDAELLERSPGATRRIARIKANSQKDESRRTALADADRHIFLPTRL
jgi:hypothetical protein